MIFILQFDLYAQKDYAERLNLITQSRNDYYAALGIPPGPPTAKGIYGEAEYSGMYGNYTITPLGNYDVPTGWPMKPYKRPYGGTPGPPVMYEKPSNPEDEGAGYGYSNGMQQQERDVFYYHSDHLGSTSYITDRNGNATQFVSYKPYGEALVDEHATSFETPWKFNGKELDSETGLYYYGARYYEPVLALWYGVDKLAEKYPSIGGYVYCVGNPIKFVDPDGNKVKFIMVKASANLGVAVGVNGSLFRGAAHDDYGVTHFSGRSYMVGDCTNSGVYGVDVSSGIEVGYNNYYKSFYDYINKSFGLNMPLEIYELIGGGIGYSAHSEDNIDGITLGMGIGEGISINFGSDNTIMQEAISVSYNEAEQINSDSFLGTVFGSTTWHVDNIVLDYTENNEVVFNGYVNGKVKVTSKAIVEEGKVKPNNIWISEEYLKQTTQNGN